MPENSSKLMSLMFVIARRMREDMKHTLLKDGCSWIHFETMRYVRENQRPLMRDVAAHFSITPPAATLLVDGLVRNKLLQRIVDPKDRRAVRVVLAANGKKMMERGIRERMKQIKELFSVLSHKERAELIRMLDKIAKNQTTS